MRTLDELAKDEFSDMTPEEKAYVHKYRQGIERFYAEKQERDIRTDLEDARAAEDEANERADEAEEEASTLAIKLEERDEEIKELKSKIETLEVDIVRLEHELEDARAKEDND